MYLIKPSFEILDFNCSPELIEKAGRTCYKSECKGEPEKFVEMICKRQHESVIEFAVYIISIIPETKKEKRRILKEINEIINSTVGFNYTICDNEIIISLNARTIKDAKIKVNNKLSNELLEEVYKKDKCIYQDIAKK